MRLSTGTYLVALGGEAGKRYGFYTSSSPTGPFAFHNASNIGYWAENATIVTALSDRDQAIKNVLHSAFSHSGQKCSATSLLVLESEVYHDARFRAGRSSDGSD